MNLTVLKISKDELVNLIKATIEECLDRSDESRWDDLLKVEDVVLCCGCRKLRFTIGTKVGKYLTTESANEFTL